MTDHSRPDIFDESGAARVWDLIVIGAGPSGSSAARVAAEAGATVLILDRARFPRYKTCGGGLIGISMAHLPAPVLATIEQQARFVRFSLRGRSVTRHRSIDPILSLVQRERFDEALVGAAVDAGAIFVDGVVVKSLVQEPGRTPETTAQSGAALVEISTNRGVLVARVVIGADGTSGRVGRYVGVEYRGTDLALELEVTRSAVTDHLDGGVYFDWGKPAGSYGWMFPKTDVITVGVIQAKGDPAATRQYLDTWMSQLGLEKSEVERSTGHLTQWRSPTSPLRRGHVLVVGDAAGLLDPWTREGISFALRSGCWAGEAAATAVRESRTGALDGYEARVIAELEPDIRAGERLLHLFERHPALVHFFLARTATGVTLFTRVCLGTATLGSLLKHRLASAALRVLRA